MSYEKEDWEGLYGISRSELKPPPNGEASISKRHLESPGLELQRQRKSSKAKLKTRRTTVREKKEQNHATAGKKRHGPMGKS